MNYREFVKQNFHKLPAEMAAKDKMRKIGEMWRASGHAKATVKGGRVVGGKVAKRGKKVDKKGGSFFSDVIGPAFDPLHLFTGGDVDGGVVGGNTRPGYYVGTRPGYYVGSRKNQQEAEGSGILSDALDSFGLGVQKKRNRKVKGGSGLANPEEGGSFFSGLLSTIGLGMNKKVLTKHHNRMMKLEQKLHKNGRLTPKEHHKLKVYHHLHGAGFFDSLFSGVKNIANKVVDNIGAIKQVVPEVVKMIPSGIKDKALNMLPKQIAMPLSIASKLL